MTSLVDAPREALVYLTSDLHLGGDLELDQLRAGGTDVTYDDSKLHMATLAKAIARRRSDLRVNAVAPGSVPTVMGFHNGPYAPDDLREGLPDTGLAGRSRRAREPGHRGEFLFHQEPETRVDESAHDTDAQDDLLDAYAARTGVTLP